VGSQLLSEEVGFEAYPNNEFTKFADIALRGFELLAQFLHALQTGTDVFGVRN
jgi:hypothetical protein